MSSGVTSPWWTLYRDPRSLASKAQEKGFGRVAAFLSLLPLAVLLRMLLWSLKPIIHIRFGQLWSHRLGSFSMGPELRLCERDASMHPKKSLDLWYHFDGAKEIRQIPVTPRQAVCNEQLNVMWGRTIHVTETARRLDRLNRMLPGWNRFSVKLNHHHDVQGLLGRFPAHLSLTESEIQKGTAGLKELGIGLEEPFICFHNRDAAYLDRTLPKNPAVLGDWRWQDLRDANIKNYIPCANSLVDLGYFAVRVGKYVEDAVGDSNPGVIDYGSHHQSDFMDVFLAARCDFFIGQNSGITALPMIFRRPMVFVNVFPFGEIGFCQYKEGILIAKKYYSQHHGRFLTFREIFDLGLAHYSIKDPKQKGLYDTLGLKIVENTPQEILEAALEMHQRLRSTFQQSEEDRQLQSRFLSIIADYPEVVIQREGSPGLKVGSHFLRTNRELLD
jgi:putative glycosyltransferase (TIGR04372 family)